MSTQEEKAYRKSLKNCYSIRNRKNFLIRCLEEKILPKSSIKCLRLSNHPFPDYSKKYLENEISKLRTEETQKFEYTRKMGTNLNYTTLNVDAVKQNIRNFVSNFNEKQKRDHEKKIKELCENSRWKEIGNQDLITNLSNTELNNYERESLSLGLKFATGTESHTSLMELFKKNYRTQDSEFDRGFIQGILISNYKQNPDPIIPKRYIDALKNLSKNNNIRITPSDKGGAIVIMNTVDYISKMQTLLSDSTTYIKTTMKEIETETELFNKSAKQIFQKLDDNKRWKRLINYRPTVPTLYGLPKTHKEGVPMRPIISGIGGAAHDIAREVAKLLTPLLGKVSDSHLKHSGALLKRIKNLTTKTKKLVSFDVVSLYTNVPVEKSISLLSNYLHTNNIKLQIPTKEIIRLCTLCTNQTFFQFNNELFKQQSGLPMGSPLSGVLACLYLEFLERDYIKKILPKNCTYTRYIDDILFICPKRTNIEDLLQKLNNIDNNIQFTCENENNGTLPFLDVLIHNTGPNLTFDVYRKSTNKNDLINFYSHHNLKIKRGLIIGFFIRAIRICSPNFLDNEIAFITQTFRKLGYPEQIINNTKKKAFKILRKTPNASPKPYKRRIILQTHEDSQTNKNFKNYDVAYKTSRTIKQLTKTKTKTDETEAGIYKINCKICDQCYIGESARPLKKRIQEHGYALRTANQLNALVTHRNKHDHTFDLKNAKMCKYEKDDRTRRILESAIIHHSNTIEQKSGFYEVASEISELFIKQFKINLNI